MPARSVEYALSPILAKAMRDVALRAGANLKLQNARAHRGVKGDRIADFEVNWKRRCSPEAADNPIPEARYAGGTAVGRSVGWRLN